MKNKYHAKRTECDGISFASLGECNCYQLLKLRERAGEIQILQFQDRIPLSKAKIVYIADFKILDKKVGQPMWIEFKGAETAVWRIKRRLWIAYGPGRLQIFKGSGLKIQLAEEIMPDQLEKSDSVITAK